MNTFVKKWQQLHSNPTPKESTITILKNNRQAVSSPKSNPHPNPPERQKQRLLRRSLSVNAVSRTSATEISEFLNKRDSPLYWTAGGSPSSPPPDAADDNKTSSGQTTGALDSNVVVGTRGRSVVSNSGVVNGGQATGGRRRSLSRVGNYKGGNGQIRGRSVSRPRLGAAAYPP